MERRVLFKTQGPMVRDEGYKCHPCERKDKPMYISGFTFLEVTLGMAVLAGLSFLTIFLVGSFSGESKDLQRIANLNSINAAIMVAKDNHINIGEENKLYVSIPDTDTNCSHAGLPAVPGWSYVCATSENLLKTDGTGWLPIDFDSLGDQNVMKALPIDPKNIPPQNYYVYATRDGRYELAAKVESNKYISRARNDGGRFDNMYETGSGIGLLPSGGSGAAVPFDIAAGLFHTIALKFDGSVWTWGRNDNGQLGDGTTDNREEAKKIMDDAIAVAAGDNHSLILKPDGTVWSWGDNEKGQLGDGSTVDRLSPVQVSGLGNVMAIDGGYRHSMALKTDGTVWAWGSNLYGQLGRAVGNVIDSAVPVQVASLSNVIAIGAAGNRSMALKSDGTVWGWGYNYYGAVGDGTSGNGYTTPRQAQIVNDAVEIAAGNFHSLAIRPDGTVWAWGRNNEGQLGDNTEDNRLTPIQTMVLNSARDISAGRDYSLASKNDGTAWSWGRNDEGQLGTNGTLDAIIPTRIFGLDSGGSSNAAIINAGSYHSVAAEANGAVWVWGDNQYGQLNYCGGSLPNSKSYIPLQAFMNLMEADITVCVIE